MKTKTFAFLSLLLIATSLLAQSTQEVQLEWAATFGGSNYEICEAVVTDNNGNVYMTGQFNDTVDFDPGPGVFNLFSNGDNDIFVVKLDTSGDLVWAKSIGGTSNDFGASIIIDSTGNIIITGGYTGTVDFNPGPGTDSHTSNGGMDIYILKLSSTGNFIWAKTMGGYYFDTGNTTIVDANGNIYTSGLFDGTVDFDPGIGVYNLVNTEGNFIFKLDAAGNFVWAVSMGEESSSEYSLALDTAGNIYSTGQFTGWADFDPGPGSCILKSDFDPLIYISKLDATGNFVWAKKIQGPHTGNSTDVAINANGDIFITGWFGGTADFDPGPGYCYLSANGWYDAFIVKLNSSCDFIWAKTMGGASEDYASAIAFDNSGNIYTTGYFKNTSDFDPGNGVFNLSSNGGYDIFISKLDVTGNFFWAKRFGSISNDFGSSIRVSTSGSIYVSGNFKDSIDFDPGIGISNFTSLGNSDAFVIKLSQTQPLISNFYASDTLAVPGDTIQFTNISNGSPSAWFWDFGDGTSDTLQNPGHIYQSVGTFSVSLIVSDSLNVDTFIIANYIDIVDPSSLSAEKPNYEWAAGFGGSGFDMGLRVSVDLKGNVYTSGKFKETVDFDPGPGVFNLTSNGQSDYFISKLDAEGNFVWAKGMGGGNEDYFSSDHNTEGSVYTIGNFIGTFDVNPNSGVYNLISNGNSDFFISKLDSLGNFMWAKSIGGSMNESGGTILIDTAGDILVSGQFNATVDFDPGPGVFYLTANGDNNTFVLKLTSSGDFVWVKNMGVNYNTFCFVDNAGNIYFDGRYTGTVDFDPGLGIFNQTSNGSNNIYMSKFNPSGNFIWSKSFANSSNDNISSLAVDDYGNVYSTGTFHTADFDPDTSVFHLSSNGQQDIFIVKLNASGDFVWAKNIGGPGGNSDHGYGLTLDEEGNVYTIGSFGGVIEITDFDPGPDVHYIASNSDADIFISKLDTEGNFVWAASVGGYSWDWGISIATDNSGNVYTTGVYKGIVDFDPGPGIANLTENGNGDAFVLKLSQHLSASFSASNTIVALGDTIQFTDLSIGQPTSWAWDFGDGTADSIQNPVHIYQNTGIYSVSLTVWNGTANDSTIIVDYILVEHIHADFSTPQTSFFYGDTIQFNDQSLGNPTAWLWDFGDGTTETLQNPIHFYESAGLFTVTLIISNASYSDTLTLTNYISVAPLQAYFIASQSVIGLNDSVQFTDQSMGNPISWFWDFGDGATDTLQNPTHVFQSPGNYTISLLAFDGLYTDTFTSINCITVYYIHAEFTASDTLINAGDTVQFTDLSSGNPISWLWNFGDGFTGTAQNPVHVYQYPGNYSVSLIVENFYNSDTVEYINFIEVAYQSIAPYWQFTNTGNNHVILITDTTTISLNGIPIEIGDYIGVFYDSLGTLACAGYKVWTGQNIAITAWGNDPGSLQPDGFSVGEEFVWKIYDYSEGTTHLAEPSYFTEFPNQQYYAVNGASGISFLNVMDIKSHYISLPQGWSIFSTYVDALEPNIDSLVSPFITEVIIAKNDDGNVFWPIWNLNAIGNILIGEGYMIKMTSPQTMVVNGTPVTPETTSLLIDQGWSLLGYLRQSPATINSMLSPIESDIHIVKNGNGQVFWPQYGLNLIGNMNPGEGYQVKMNSAQVLTYPAN